MNFLKVEPGSDSETCHVGNQVIDIKIEEVTDIKVEVDPVLITFPVIKAEDEVSCTSAYSVNHISQICTTSYCLSCHHLFVIHMKQLHCNERILKCLENYIYIYIYIF
jgi:hypothetical protein